MKLRQEQIEAFEPAARKNFEDRMVVHLKKYFGKRCEVVTESAVRDMIRYGIDRAVTYDIITQRDLCNYLSLMLLLGSDFDTDPQLPWAAEILADESIKDDPGRVARLYDRGMTYLDQAVGVDNEYLHELARLRNKSVDDLAAPGEGEFEDRMLVQLDHIYPQKYGAVGEECAFDLVREGTRTAKGYGIKGERGRGVFIVVMFLLGHGFATDPQFYWAAKVLGDRSIRDEDTRVERLYKGVVRYFEKWIS